eukprot:TRINITY_DN8977_c0_g1_i5.p1 TRINITY_DN8977_c0_g1~~TRINITY_DN8977_c0_g1_i5.p1  ORF type:complete len:3056 (+),score=507.04 TRINITY_DN8977_c0_g1_i5:62-9229(+)
MRFGATLLFVCLVIPFVDGVRAVAGDSSRRSLNADRLPNASAEMKMARRMLKNAAALPSDLVAKVEGLPGGMLQLAAASSSNSSFFSEDKLDTALEPLSAAFLVSGVVLGLTKFANIYATSLFSEKISRESYKNHMLLKQSLRESCAFLKRTFDYISYQQRALRAVLDMLMEGNSKPPIDCGVVAPWIEPWVELLQEVEAQILGLRDMVGISSPCGSSLENPVTPISQAIQARDRCEKRMPRVRLARSFARQRSTMYSPLDQQSVTAANAELQIGRMVDLVAADLSTEMLEDTKRLAGVLGLSPTLEKNRLFTMMGELLVIDYWTQQSPFREWHFAWVEHKIVDGVAVIATTPKFVSSGIPINIELVATNFTLRKIEHPAWKASGNFQWRCWVGTLLMYASPRDVGFCADGEYAREEWMRAMRFFAGTSRRSIPEKATQRAMDALNEFNSVPRGARRFLGQMSMVCDKGPCVIYRSSADSDYSESELWVQEVGADTQLSKGPVVVSPNAVVMKKKHFLIKDVRPDDPDNRGHVEPVMSEKKFCVNVTTMPKQAEVQWTWFHKTPEEKQKIFTVCHPHRSKVRRFVSDLLWAYVRFYRLTGTIHHVPGDEGPGASRPSSKRQTIRGPAEPPLVGGRLELTMEKFRLYFSRRNVMSLMCMPASSLDGEKPRTWELVEVEFALDTIRFQRGLELSVADVVDATVFKLEPGKNAADTVQACMSQQMHCLSFGSRQKRSDKHRVLCHTDEEKMKCLATGFQQFEKDILGNWQPDKIVEDLRKPSLPNPWSSDAFVSLLNGIFDVAMPRAKRVNRRQDCQSGCTCVAFESLYRIPGLSTRQDDLDSVHFTYRNCPYDASPGFSLAEVEVRALSKRIMSENAVSMSDIAIRKWDQPVLKVVFTSSVETAKKPKSPLPWADMLLPSDKYLAIREVFTAKEVIMSDRYLTAKEAWTSPANTSFELASTDTEGDVSVDVLKRGPFGVHVPLGEACDTQYVRDVFDLLWLYTRAMDGVDLSEEWRSSMSSGIESFEEFLMRPLLGSYHDFVTRRLGSIFSNWTSASLLKQCRVSEVSVILTQASTTRRKTEGFFSAENKPWRHDQDEEESQVPQQSFHQLQPDKDAVRSALSMLWHSQDAHGCDVSQIYHALEEKCIAFCWGRSGCVAVPSSVRGSQICKEKGYSQNSPASPECRPVCQTLFGSHSGCFLVAEKPETRAWSDEDMSTSAFHGWTSWNNWVSTATGEIGKTLNSWVMVEGTLQVLNTMSGHKTVVSKVVTVGALVSNILMATQEVMDILHTRKVFHSEKSYMTTATEEKLNMLAYAQCQLIDSIQATNEGLSAKTSDELSVFERVVKSMETVTKEMNITRRLVLSMVDALCNPVPSSIEGGVASCNRFFSDMFAAGSRVPTGLPVKDAIRNFVATTAKKTFSTKGMEGNVQQCAAKFPLEDRRAQRSYPVTGLQVGWYMQDSKGKVGDPGFHPWLRFSHNSAQGHLLDEVQLAGTEDEYAGLFHAGEFDNTMQTSSVENLDLKLGHTGDSKTVLLMSRNPAQPPITAIKAEILQHGNSWSKRAVDSKPSTSCYNYAASSAHGHLTPVGLLPWQRAVSKCDGNTTTKEGNPKHVQDLRREYDPHKCWNLARVQDCGSLKDEFTCLQRCTGQGGGKSGRCVWENHYCRTGLGKFNRCHDYCGSKSLDVREAQCKSFHKTFDNDVNPVDTVRCGGSVDVNYACQNNRGAGRQDKWVSRSPKWYEILLATEVSANEPPITNLVFSNDHTGGPLRVDSGGPNKVETYYRVHEDLNRQCTWGKVWGTTSSWLWYKKDWSLKYGFSRTQVTAARVAEFAKDCVFQGNVAEVPAWEKPNPSKWKESTHARFKPWYSGCALCRFSSDDPEKEVCTSDVDTKAVTCRGTSLAGHVWLEHPIGRDPQGEMMYHRLTWYGDVSYSSQTGCVVNGMGEKTVATMRRVSFGNGTTQWVEATNALPSRVAGMLEDHTYIGRAEQASGKETYFLQGGQDKVPQRVMCTTLHQQLQTLRLGHVLKPAPPEEVSLDEAGRRKAKGKRLRDYTIALRKCIDEWNPNIGHDKRLNCSEAITACVYKKKEGTFVGAPPDGSTVAGHLRGNRVANHVCFPNDAAAMRFPEAAEQTEEANLEIAIEGYRCHDVKEESWANVELPAKRMPAGYADTLWAAAVKKGWVKMAYTHDGWLWDSIKYKDAFVILSPCFGRGPCSLDVFLADPLNAKAGTCATSRKLKKCKDREYSCKDTCETTPNRFFGYTDYKCGDPGGRCESNKVLTGKSCPDKCGSSFKAVHTISLDDDVEAVPPDMEAGENRFSVKQGSNTVLVLKIDKVDPRHSCVECTDTQKKSLDAQSWAAAINQEAGVVHEAFLTRILPSGFGKFTYAEKEDPTGDTARQVVGHFAQGIQTGVGYREGGGRSDEKGFYNLDALTFGRVTFQPKDLHPDQKLSVYRACASAPCKYAGHFADVRGQDHRLYPVGLPYPASMGWLQDASGKTLYIGEMGLWYPLGRGVYWDHEKDVVFRGVLTKEYFAAGSRTHYLPVLAGHLSRIDQEVPLEADKVLTRLPMPASVVENAEKLFGVMIEAEGQSGTGGCHQIICRREAEVRFEKFMREYHVVETLWLAISSHTSFELPTTSALQERLKTYSKAWDKKHVVETVADRLVQLRAHISGLETNQIKFMSDVGRRAVESMANGHLSRHTNAAYLESWDGVLQDYSIQRKVKHFVEALKTFEAKVWMSFRKTSHYTRAIDRLLHMINDLFCSLCSPVTPEKCCSAAQQPAANATKAESSPRVLKVRVLEARNLKPTDVDETRMTTSVWVEAGDQKSQTVDAENKGLTPDFDTVVEIKEGPDGKFDGSTQLKVIVLQRGKAANRAGEWTTSLINVLSDKESNAAWFPLQEVHEGKPQDFCGEIRLSFDFSSVASHGDAKKHSLCEACGPSTNVATIIDSLEETDDLFKFTVSLNRIECMDRIGSSHSFELGTTCRRPVPHPWNKGAVEDAVKIGPGLITKDDSSPTGLGGLNIFKDSSTASAFYEGKQYSDLQKRLSKAAQAAVS